MNTKEILAQRELVADYLLANLHEYGNIEPPGFYGRPEHGFGEYMTPTAKANYLRVAAWLTEDSPKSPNFLTDAQIQALHAVIKPGAVPVYMEYWSGNPQTGYEVRLKPSYNVMDVTCYHPLVQALQQAEPVHDTEADKEALKNFIDPYEVADGLEYDADGEPLDPKADDFYLRLVTSAAKVSGLDEPSSKLFAQLVFKTYRVTMPLPKSERLFSEEEIAAFEQDPGSLFKAVNAACNLLSKYDHTRVMSELYTMQDTEAEKRAATLMQEEEESQLQVKPEPAETENAENTETLIEGKTDAFKGLRIHYKFIDATLHDAEGKPFPYKNATLTGEKAYEFLVALNKMDKEMFFNKGADSGDGKCRLSISYKDLNYNDGMSFRLDLGDLELGNQKSIAKALEHRLTGYSRQIMTDEGLQNALSEENYGKEEADTKVTPEELRQSAIGTIAEIQTAMETFAVEEETYLAQHPELKTENEADAHPFVYMCRKEDFDQFLAYQCIEQLPPETVQNYCAFPTSFKMDALTRPSTPFTARRCADYVKVRKSIPDGFVVFASNWSPEEMAEQREKGRRVLSLVSEKTVQDLRDMTKLSLTVTTRDAYAPEAGTLSHQVYYGSRAIEEMQSLVKSDLDYVRLARQDNLYIPSNKITDVQLSFDDQPITTASGRVGDGTFVMRLKGENFLGNSEKSIPEARETFAVYNHFANDGWPDDLQYSVWYEDREFIEKGGVSPEISLKTWMEHVSDHEPEPKKGSVSQAYLQDCVEAYFKRYALLATAGKEGVTHEDVLKAGARRMLEAGHNCNRVKQVARYWGGEPRDFLCRYADSAEMMSIERQMANKANCK